jgi:hypothetical protein
MRGWYPGSVYAPYKSVSYLASTDCLYFGHRPVFTDRQGGHNALMISVFRDGIVYYIYLLCEPLLSCIDVTLTYRVPVFSMINAIICLAAPRDLSYVLGP